ncbi:TPA: hypothetical protein QIB97_001322 [Proteus mirabilis]|nr:hypothetical protein [Proteus mirabilis]
MSKMTSKSYKLPKELIDQIIDLSEKLNVPQNKIIEDAIANYRLHLITNYSKQDVKSPFEIDMETKPNNPYLDINQVKNMKVNDFIILKLKINGEHNSASFYCSLKIVDINELGGIAEFKGIRPSEAYKTFTTFQEFQGSKIAFRHSDVFDYLSAQDVELRGEETLYYHS